MWSETGGLAPGPVLFISTVSLWTQNQETRLRVLSSSPYRWLLLSSAHFIRGSCLSVQTGGYQEPFQYIYFLLKSSRINSFCLSPKGLNQWRTHCYFKDGLILMAIRLPLRQELRLIKEILVSTSSVLPRRDAIKAFKYKFLNSERKSVWGWFIFA